LRISISRLASFLGLIAFCQFNQPSFGFFFCVICLAFCGLTTDSPVLFSSRFLAAFATSAPSLATLALAKKSLGCSKTEISVAATSASIFSTNSVLVRTKIDKQERQKAGLMVSHNETIRRGRRSLSARKALKLPMQLQRPTALGSFVSEGYRDVVPQAFPRLSPGEADALPGLYKQFWLRRQVFDALNDEGFFYRE
jgi:hypothetical protein